MTKDEIRDTRRRLGLTQAAFAVRLNATIPGLRVNQISVSRWERGIVRPSGVAMAAIARLGSVRLPDVA